MLGQYDNLEFRESTTIALDAMGADLGPGIVLDAAASTLARFPDLNIILVGDESVLGSHPTATHTRVAVRHAAEVVTMDDTPSEALRRKKQSSMRAALDCVREGEAAACISGGNTGALMATAMLVLRTVTGIKRPAIMAEIPTTASPTYLLDVGANASCDAEQLYQFAVMGSIVARPLSGAREPRLALLNIGSEAGKGDDRIQTAAQRLAASNLNYIGFVEGNDLGKGVAEVIVTDGFTGNVALKTMEGTASLVGHFMRASFNRSPIGKLQALFSRGSLRHLANTLDPRGYNGASFVGLNGIVIKSHGGADAKAFEHAIETALLEIRDNAPAAIARWMSNEAV
ncbi:MAG: phosphate acyltransferase PlsX [Pseudomonadota bacterium]